jgi:hypothetical protein
MTLGEPVTELRTRVKRVGVASPSGLRTAKVLAGARANDSGVSGPLVGQQGWAIGASLPDASGQPGRAQNRRSRASHRAQKTAPERRSAPSWPRRRTALPGAIRRSGHRSSTRWSGHTEPDPSIW